MIRTVRSGAKVVMPYVGPYTQLRTPLLATPAFRPLKSQRGVILLISMLILLSGSAFFLAGEYRDNPYNDDSALEALLAAKQALLSYAVNYADNYGHNTRGGTGRLPCPARARFSSPASSCGVNEIGYLPSAWLRSGELMEIDYLERFLDRDIWYAVAADHRYNPSHNTLNSNTRSNLLSVDGVPDIVAVLIYPGSAMAGQNRFAVQGMPPASTVFEYLEGENADADGIFTLTEKGDLLVPIRRAELMPLIERRVLGFAKQWLIEYKAQHGYYPYASSTSGHSDCSSGVLNGFLSTDAGSCAEMPLADMRFTDLPANRTLRNTWFYRYDWPQLIYYLVDESCAPVRGIADCDGVDDPVRALSVDGVPAEVILISVGEPIETVPVGGLQQRLIGGGIASYLDTEALLSAVTAFEIPELTSHSNDQLVFID